MIPTSPDFGYDISDVDINDPPRDPIALMIAWLPPHESELRPLSALATIGLEGIPTVRHVLVSDADENGLYFHTDGTSRKAAELAASPVAALSVAWPSIGRQLSVRGAVEQLSPEESGIAYRLRSRYLKLLAWQNTPEVALLPRDERRARWAAFDAEHPDLEPPTAWAGYRIRPRTITFWRGDAGGPSNRHEYALGADGWTSAVLPG